MIRYDFLCDGHWIGPWFLPNELLFWWHGWLPSERRRRRAIQRATELEHGERVGYWRGFEAGKAAVLDLFEAQLRK